MIIRNLSLADFKNYEQLSLDLSPGINCFIGNNGVGKTNLLDAIYYLSFCKSFSNPSDSNNVRHDQGYFAIHGDFIRAEGDTLQLSCIVQKGKKKVFKYNKKEYDRLADHIGKVPLVMVSPADQELITGASDLRRRFMDGVISQFDRTYLSLILDYQKVIAQRNALLKIFAEKSFFDSDALDIWDTQLIQLGSAIFESRKRFIEGFSDIFQFYFEKIADSSEKVSVEYKSDFFENDFAQILKDSRSKDRMLKYTTKGIHKDDLLFSISSYPVRKYGSQGQQKSFVVAIKLAQFDFIKKQKEITPILLLDDIFDKLDDERVGKLIHLVGKDLFGQVFITDTNLDRVKRLFESGLLEHQVFHVNHAEIQKI